MTEEQTQNTEQTPDEALENAEKEKKKKKIKFGPGAIISVFMVSLFALAGIGYFYTWPMYERVEDNKSTITEHESEIDEKNDELRKQKKANEEFANMSEEEIKLHLTPEELELRKKLPLSIDVPDLIRDMDHYAKLAQEDDNEEVFLGSFSFGKEIPVKEAKLKILPINASLSSHMFALSEYLKTLENDDHRLINVKNISISVLERDFKYPIEVFADEDDNKDYESLLRKRAYFLLTDSEEKRLAEYQQDIFEEFEEIRFKSNKTDAEIERLTMLQTEVETIQAEATYTVSMETYFNLTDVEANALKK